MLSVGDTSETESIPSMLSHVRYQDLTVLNIYFSSCEKLVLAMQEANCPQFQLGSQKESSCPKNSQVSQVGRPVLAMSLLPNDGRKTPSPPPPAAAGLEAWGLISFP